MNGESRIVTVAAAIIVAALLLVVGSARVLGQMSEPNSRKPAPAFSLSDANGSTIQLSDYKGKVVLLNFWATWCHGCKTEIPWYAEFQRNYGSRGLTVVGASMDDDGWKVVKPFIGATKVNYPMVLATEDLAKQYGLGAMPLSVLIDRKGRIAASHSGVVDRDDWEAEIQQLLAEPQ